MTFPALKVLGIFAGPGNTPGIRVFITRRMRRELIDDLGYLSSEVDEMEPSVAAVVIERGLARPSNGMPSSWKIPSANKGGRQNKLFRFIGGTFRIINGIVNNSILAVKVASTKMASLTIAIIVVPFLVNVLTSEEGLTRESVSQAATNAKGALEAGAGEIKQGAKQTSRFMRAKITEKKSAGTSSFPSLKGNFVSNLPHTGKASHGSCGGSSMKRKTKDMKGNAAPTVATKKGATSAPNAGKPTNGVYKSEQPTPFADSKKSRFSKITSNPGSSNLNGNVGKKWWTWGGKNTDGAGANGDGGEAAQLDFDSFETVMDGRTNPADSIGVKLGILKNSLFPSKYTYK